jgi:acyl-coenzyme A thioesterase PaaI-like protein
MKNVDFFQNHMPGNVCFGCGQETHDGLKISSFWEGEEAICVWKSEEKYQGWKGILNGGVLATLIDCNTMCTAMSAVYQSENRELSSSPTYRYATGTIKVKYLKPTSNLHPVELRAKVIEIKGRKVVLKCIVISQGAITAEADVVAIRVFDSSKETSTVFGQ